MAFVFYCTECGKKLTQEDVYINLAPIITSNEYEFKLLRFRVSLDYLMSIIEHGQEASDQYKSCKLTFLELMQIASDDKNLKDPAVAALTLNDVESYLASETKIIVKKAKTDDLLDDDSDDTEEKAKKEKKDPELKPAVQAILNSSRKQQAGEFDEGSLHSDFQAIRAAFGYETEISFDLKLDSENDTTGKPVTLGYWCRTPKNKFRNMVRICPYCSSPIFSLAGTAKHQTIGMLGYRSAGKTSTILALASYVQNGLTNLGTLWNSAESLESYCQEAQLLSPSPNLLKDLQNFEGHIAPNPTKTSNGKEATYSATFLIKDKNRVNHLISLIDIPGEMFYEDGTIDEKNLFNQFQVSLSCDAYVSFFDVTETQHTVAEATNVCRWTDQMQRLRLRQMGVSSYVPVMLLFTKCADLEENPPKESLTELTNALKPSAHPIKNSYIFRVEKEAITCGDNKIFDYVCRKLSEVGDLKTAFHAVMRCSPYGYAAPVSSMASDAEHPIDENAAPIHVDWLMKWILSLTGAIAPNAKFLRLDNTFLESGDYQLSRQQERKQNPAECNEAICRAYLFDNPGRFDCGWLESSHSKAATAVHKTKMKLSPNSNDIDS